MFPAASRLVGNGLEAQPETSRLNSPSLQFEHPYREGDRGRNTGNRAHPFQIRGVWFGPQDLRDRVGIEEKRHRGQSNRLLARESGSRLTRAGTVTILVLCISDT